VHVRCVGVSEKMESAAEEIMVAVRESGGWRLPLP